jgi:hypothetical protein
MFGGWISYTDNLKEHYEGVQYKQCIFHMAKSMAVGCFVFIKVETFVSGFVCIYWFARKFPAVC